MFVLVVTGGIAAGKSTAGRAFGARGAVVIDADDLAREVMAPGSGVLAEVADAFGDDVLCPDGTLDRPALAQRAFDSPSATARLGAIVHPAVAKRAAEVLAGLRASTEPPEVAVLLVPLLVEAPRFAELADEVLAIAAPAQLRLQRSVDFGRDRDDAERRLQAQSSDEARAELADEVIVNDADEIAFRQRLDEYWERRVAPRLAR